MQPLCARELGKEGRGGRRREAGGGRSWKREEEEEEGKKSVMEGSQVVCVWHGEGEHKGAVT